MRRAVYGGWSAELAWRGGAGGWLAAGALGALPLLPRGLLDGGCHADLAWVWAVKMDVGGSGTRCSGLVSHVLDLHLRDMMLDGIISVCMISKIKSRNFSSLLNLGGITVRSRHMNETESYFFLFFHMSLGLSTVDSVEGVHRTIRWSARKSWTTREKLSSE